MRGNFDLWSDSHIFYNELSSTLATKLTTESKADYLWREKIYSETPNGLLLKKNSFFSNIHNNGKQYFAHITFGLQEILQSQSIFVSGGCLVGSVYCVPLTQDENGLRLHNLGEYIYSQEAYILSQKHYEGKSPNIIVFEVDNASSLNNHLIGIDYLRLGKIHNAIYKDLVYLLSLEERYKLEGVVCRSIKNSFDFLELCRSMFYEKRKLNPEHFISCYIDAINNLTILGYLYFEAVCEFVVFHQDSKISNKYKEVGEIYNEIYKSLMYDLAPQLQGNFKLSAFCPSLDSIYEYLFKKKVIGKITKTQMGEYISERLLILVMSHLLSGSEHTDWKRFEWTFDNVSHTIPSLVGHLLHRELRNHGRYPSFYFYFDQTKALQIWNYWNHMDVTIPFNGIMPKGEVGINPAHPDIKYKTYIGEAEVKKGFTYVNLGKQIDVVIEPRLVALRYTTMRNKAEDINLKK